MESSRTRVMVAPLDWGLGHATRCIPVIRELLKQHIQVLLCASGNGLQILQDNFPNLPVIDIQGISIRYPANDRMTAAILMQLPSILKAIDMEHQLLDKIIDDEKITHVISDNRYGLYSDKVKSAFISHQLNIQTGKLMSVSKPLLRWLHKKRIQKFHELWIPDNSAPGNLSGNLSGSNGFMIPVRHIGLLSRFESAVSGSEKKYDCIALLSGPEPQRTLLENKLRKSFVLSGRKCLLIQGKPGISTSSMEGNLTVCSSISDRELRQILHPDSVLICRSGYSTIMDLSILSHRKVLFIPTPGQTEQEYLALEMKNKFGYSIMQQNEEILLDNIHSGKFLPGNNNQDSLKKTIGEFISS